MKKILLTAISLVAGATLVHAQGWMQINGSAANVTTNTTSYYSEGAGTTGKTAAGASAFDYTVLVSATQITDGPADTGWTVVETVADATVLAGGSGLGAGEILYNGAGGQFESDIAVGSYYDEVVGWSSNLGSSWTTVEAELTGNSNAGNWSANGYFGWAASPSALFATAASSPGDNAIGANGVPAGSLVLFAVGPSVSPEPTTLALAGLGGLSMLFLRRRKS